MPKYRFTFSIDGDGDTEEVAWMRAIELNPGISMNDAEIDIIKDNRWNVDCGFGLWYQIEEKDSGFYIFRIYSNKKLLFDDSQFFSNEESCSKAAKEYIIDYLL